MSHLLLFENQQYADYLSSLSLLTNIDDDLLLKKGISLLRLGRFEESVEIFNDLGKNIYMNTTIKRFLLFETNLLF